MARNRKRTKPGDRTKTIGALVDELMTFQEEMKRKHGVLPDSTALIRAMRDEE